MKMYLFRDRLKYDEPAQIIDKFWFVSSAVNGAEDIIEKF